MDSKNTNKSVQGLPKGALMLFWIRRKSIPRVLLLAACKNLKKQEQEQKEQHQNE